MNGETGDVQFSHPSNMVCVELFCTGSNLFKSFNSEFCLLHRSVSLSSLYSLLKASLCPYFYICSYQVGIDFFSLTQWFKGCSHSGLAGHWCSLFHCMSD